MVRLLHQDLSAGKQNVIHDSTIDRSMGEQILLTLSRASAASDAVTAEYQFLRRGAPTSAPTALKGSAAVFGGEQNWTRAEFFAFEPTPPRGR